MSAGAAVTWDLHSAGTSKVVPSHARCHDRGSWKAGLSWNTGVVSVSVSVSLSLSMWLQGFSMCVSIRVVGLYT